MSRMNVPGELIDLIALHVEAPQFWDCGYTPRPTQIYEARGYSELANLRLVSKAFRSSATPRLFREVNATMTSRVNGRLQTRPLNKLLELSRAEYAQHVRVITVGIARVLKEHETMMVANYIRDLGSILPACFPSYPRLKTLCITGPCYPGGHKEDLPFPADLKRSLIKTIEITLSHAPAKSFTELSLALPITHDFASLIGNQCTTLTRPTQVEDLLATLSHLDVTIGDNSGLGGQHWMLKPRSDTQEAYPNEAFAPEFFKFIEFANNVKTLRINATHVLDMDLLNTGRFSNLRILELKNLKVSWDRLVAVVEKNTETLHAVGLEGIQLKSGTWKALLLKFCSLARLDYYVMDLCSYSTDGLSAAMVPAAAADLDSEIETNSIHDYHALGHLQRRVIYRRDLQGLPQMMTFDLKYSNWKTLEEVEALERQNEGIWQ